MSTCFERHKITTHISKETDVDLERLIQHLDDDETSQTDQSSSTGGDVQALNGSNESLASVEEDYHRPPSTKQGFLEKHIFKSLPISIFNKTKSHGLTCDVTYSTPNSPTSKSLSPTSESPKTADPLLRRRTDPVACKIQHHTAKQMIWSVWISDLQLAHEVELPQSSTCALLLHTLLTKLNRNPDLTLWSILEQNSEKMIERCVEDYELMDDVLTDQEPEHISRFCLNRTSAKYNILQHPELCLPHGMLTLPPNSNPIEDAPDSVRRLQMQHILTKTAPEMCGWLHVREGGRRFWKKVYCVLRNSGLYFSSKGTSKSREHLSCLAEVHSARVWSPINKKHSSNGPTAFSFCLKPKSYNHGTSARWFCAETNHSKSAWINALRLTMNGSRFYESYLSARRYGPSNLVRSSSDRSINRYEANHVAMDFSGSSGRVIHDPQEVTMVELEQQTAWRRKLINRTIQNSNGPGKGVGGNSAPTNEVAFFTRAIHVTQPWFYGKMSREAATDEIQKHGNLDGTFLVRESYTIPGGIVLTLCHNQKSRHIPISLRERDCQHFYTSDNGETVFLDLIMLIDFHRLNKGSLPCVLLHECRRRYNDASRI